MLLRTPLGPSLEQVVGSAPTAHARGAPHRGAWPGGPGGGTCARREEEPGFGPRREPGVAVTQVRRRLAVTGLAMERKGERRSGLRHEERRRLPSGRRAPLPAAVAAPRSGFALAAGPLAAASSGAPRPRPSLRSPQAGAARPHGRPEPLRARRARQPPCSPGSRPRARPAAARPCGPAFSRLSPPPSHTGPSSIPLSRSARAPGPKEKDQGQEGQSPKEVSLVPPTSQPFAGVSSGTSSRVARLGRARGFRAAPPTPPRHMASGLLGE